MVVNTFPLNFHQKLVNINLSRISPEKLYAKSFSGLSKLVERGAKSHNVTLNTSLHIAVHIQRT